MSFPCLAQQQSPPSHHINTYRLPSPLLLPRARLWVHHLAALYSLVWISTLSLTLEAQDSAGTTAILTRSLYGLNTRSTGHPLSPTPSQVPVKLIIITVSRNFIPWHLIRRPAPSIAVNTHPRSHQLINARLAYTLIYSTQPRRSIIRNDPDMNTRRSVPTGWHQIWSPFRFCTPSVFIMKSDLDMLLVPPAQYPILQQHHFMSAP